MVRQTNQIRKGAPSSSWPMRPGTEVSTYLNYIILRLDQRQSIWGFQLFEFSNLNSRLEDIQLQLVRKPKTKKCIASWPPPDKHFNGGRTEEAARYVLGFPSLLSSWRNGAIMRSMGSDKIPSGVPC